MNKEPDDWITINGQHVPIFEGEGKREAVSRFINNKMSRVKKNKDKYNTIDTFKKRKATNKLEENEQKKETKKGMQFIKKGNTYIPIRSEEDEARFKNIKFNTDYQPIDEKEDFYENVAKFHAEEYKGRKQGKKTDKVYYYGTDKEAQDEINSKLDAIVDKGEKPTKEQVREVIENYVKRKATNKLPEYKARNENDINELQKEKNYLDKEIERRESGRVFNVRDNVENQQNYLMTMKNYMPNNERIEYESLKERRDEILRKIRELKDK